MFRPIFLLLTAALLVVPAIAKAGERSLVIGYPVKGTSAKAIYDDIKAQSPRIAANATFSFMAMATKTDKTERKRKDSCGYSHFRTSVVYSFVLPKLSSSKGVKPALATQWLNFYDYLKTHEEDHRSFWRVCFAEYDQQALDLSARDCAVLDKKRENLFTAIKHKCIRQDEAYDVGFRKDVRKHPFVVQGLGEKTRTGGMLSLFKKK